MKKIATLISAALTASVLAVSAQAAEVTLRFHQFLPLHSAIPGKGIEPWIKKIEAESGGRIEIQHYPSMQLGGSPPSLYGQARDGVVDIIWTVLGYSPGLFPTAEAFELPFMTGNAEQGSVAFQKYMEANGMGDFKEVHPLGFHVHGPGIIHTKGGAVKSLADMQGKKLRGPTRVITGMLKELGATPVGMPVPAVPESLSKGVIDGAVIPYEVSVPLKVAQLTDGHMGFEGDTGLYTATFGVIMNKAKYDSMPADLRAILDAHSGVEMARAFGKVMDDADKVGLKIARDAGNEVVFLNAEAKATWQAAAQPVIDGWIAEMNGKGLDGAGLVAAARAAIAAEK
ncbi:MAG: TRAP transporter substrate-binding protein [Alphaproteobacteria bacterium]|nr:TRAP transporter substrate-binding protein [Alphaproteobacteria bacterium]